MNNYEEKRQRYIESLRRKSNNHSKAGQQLQQKSFDAIAAIPAGQPVLTSSHRRLLNRSDSNMQKGEEEFKKADDYAYRAEAAERNTSISSDDPEALKKIQEKIKEAESLQEYMKDANKYYKKHGSFVGFRDMGKDEAEGLMKELSNIIQRYGRPYTHSTLTNNNANIKRLKKRVQALEWRDNFLKENEGWEFDGGRVRFNAEENRIQIIFDSQPDRSLIDKLDSMGFNYSPYTKIWQRQINFRGVRITKRIEEIAPIGGAGV